MQFLVVKQVVNPHRLFITDIMSQGAKHAISKSVKKKKLILLKLQLVAHRCVYANYISIKPMARRVTYENNINKAYFIVKIDVK